MLDTVLLVEDCPRTIACTKFFLHKLGVKNILTANNHVDFTALLTSDIKLDLVVTDWQIDETLNGGDVVSAVSDLDIPVAVLTSEKSIAVDQNKYPIFQKPLDIERFKNWLSKLQ